ncbi:hypothetical protein [Anaerobaca lacustris]|uniref:Lipoprotein n=1 Tax=Anaerobaca lacustris TaxID=3044600 RepID=A0AAW6TVL0_9BACT|nr:hypothetical protein [Sedimentisphaerales bacterium M17dextr]
MRATRRTMTQEPAASGLASFGLVALAGSFFALCGCAAQWYVRSDPLAYSRLVGPYRHIQLKASSTLDALGAFDAPDHRLDPEATGRQLVSQSDTTIAVCGQSANARRTWVTLVAFDEHRMTARRKYFFCIDEWATAAPTERGQKLVPPRKGLVFDAELVLAPEIQTTPYATEEARQLATVRWLIEQFAADARRLSGPPGQSAQANELVSLAAMMMNQTFEGLMIELAKSHGLARRFSDPKGVAFPHISMNEGRLQLTTAAGITTAKLRVNLPM